MLIFMIIDDKSGFFIKKPYVNKLFAMRYFGVKRNSYAGSVIERIYDYYCTGASSTFIDYLKYYKYEFDSYDDFLMRKYNFFIEEINDINKYLLFYKNLHLTEDGGLENMMYDETFRETVVKFLGGSSIEN